MAGAPIEVTAWVPNFDPQRAYFSSAPVWVRLLGLPLDFWSEKDQRLISVLLGKFIRMDPVTQSLGRMGKKATTVRILVEVGMQKPLTREVLIQTGLDRRIHAIQPLVLENPPPECPSYKRLHIKSPP